MASLDANVVAARFFRAWTAGDFDTARDQLDDVSFAGPLEKFDHSETYIGARRGLAQIVKGVEEQNVFVDGNDVCVIYNLITNTPAGSSPTAEWYHLRDGEISSVRVLFDARPFAAMFEQGSGH